MKAVILMIFYLIVMDIRGGKHIMICVSDKNSILKRRLH